LARTVADRVERAQSKLKEAESQFERNLREASGRPELIDQLLAWERRVQQELKALREQLQKLQDELAQARKAVEEQQNRVRAWDKLLERLDEEARVFESSLEMRRADEAYLQKQSRQRKEQAS
jgi:archaellum component FlaC